MRVVVPGHIYLLDQLDTGGFQEPRQYITFVKRVGEGYPGNEGDPHRGVTVQEVCRVLIDRLQYVQNQAAHFDDQLSVQIDQECIEDLRAVIRLLEHRAAVRHERPILMPGDRWRYPELQPTCRGCGHVGCSGGCGRT